MAHGVIRNVFRQTGTSDITLYNSERSAEVFYGTTLSVNKIGTANKLRAGAGGCFASKTSRPIVGVAKSLIQWVLKSFLGK
jgi:hypothetical protein